jgi:ATP-dependent DNA ligase
LKAAARLGLEGVVSKKRGSAYRSGRCHAWVKIKSTEWRDANRERWKLFERRG